MLIPSDGDGNEALPLSADSTAAVPNAFTSDVGSVAYLTTKLPAKETENDDSEAADDADADTMLTSAPSFAPVWVTAEVVQVETPMRKRDAQLYMYGAPSTSSVGVPNKVIVVFDAAGANLEDDVYKCLPAVPDLAAQERQRMHGGPGGMAAEVIRQTIVSTVRRQPPRPPPGAPLRTHQALHPRRRDGVDLRAIELTDTSIAAGRRPGQAFGAVAFAPDFGNGGPFGMLLDDGDGGFPPPAPYHMDPFLGGPGHGNPFGPPLGGFGAASRKGLGAAAAAAQNENDHVGTVCFVTKQAPISGSMFRKVNDSSCTLSKLGYVQMRFLFFGGHFYFFFFFFYADVRNIPMTPLVPFEGTTRSQWKSSGCTKCWNGRVLPREPLSRHRYARQRA